MASKATRPDMSPFRPLPEQEVVELVEEVVPVGTAEEDELEDATVEAVSYLDDAAEFVEEDEPVVTPEKEKYFEVAKDYGAIGEED